MVSKISSRKTNPTLVNSSLKLKYILFYEMSKYKEWFSENWMIWKRLL